MGTALCDWGRGRVGGETDGRGGHPGFVNLIPLTMSRFIDLIDLIQLTRFRGKTGGERGRRGGRSPPDLAAHHPLFPPIPPSSPSATVSLPLLGAIQPLLHPSSHSTSPSLPYLQVTDADAVLKPTLTPTPSSPSVPSPALPRVSPDPAPRNGCRLSSCVLSSWHPLPLRHPSPPCFDADSGTWSAVPLFSSRLEPAHRLIACPPLAPPAPSPLAQPS
jgi:hypothetical protein